MPTNPTSNPSNPSNTATGKVGDQANPSALSNADNPSTAAGSTNQSNATIAAGNDPNSDDAVEVQQPPAPAVVINDGMSDSPVARQLPDGSVRAYTDDPLTDAVVMLLRDYRKTHSDPTVVAYANELLAQLAPDPDLPEQQPIAQEIRANEIKAKMEAEMNKQKNDNNSDNGGKSSGATQLPSGVAKPVDPTKPVGTEAPPVRTGVPLGQPVTK